MSLLLCRLEPVKHPFVVAELGVRLFSSQELCYVIYENPLLVMEDFVDERLIQFIREDLDMDFLAGKLENWKKSGEDPDNMLLLILAECSYYTSGEVNRYRQTLIQLRKKHPAEFGKIRADYLFGKRQYGRGIALYEKPLEFPKDNVVNDLFFSRVWCCLGACHARMFQAEKAYRAYEKAYFYDNRNEKILEQIYYLKAMFPNISIAPRMQSMLKLIRKEDWNLHIDQARKKGEESGAVKELDKLFLKDEAQCLDGASKLVQQWKQEYRGMM